MKRASVQMAFLPSWCRLPACAPLPCAVTVRPPVPLRRVMIRSSLRPDSNTNAACAPLPASRTSSLPSGEPTSSSDTLTTRTGVRASSPASASAPSANAITTRPPFMSSTPGPRNSSPSSRNPAKVALGNTVS